MCAPILAKYMEIQVENLYLQTDIGELYEIEDPSVSFVTLYEDPAPETPVKPKRKPSCSREKRKLARQSGKEYINTRNMLVKAKKFKYKICDKCPFKCTSRITYEAAKCIHDEFWKLSDTLKNKFYERTTQKEFKKRERKRIPSNENSRRTYSFLYFFHVGSDRVRVCRDFYVKTLNISPRRVAHYHEKVFEGVAMPHVDGRGKKTKIKIPEETRQLIRQHINSFPSEELLECKLLVKSPTALNTTKMYELYVKQCIQNNLPPAKLWLYRKIFRDEMVLREHPERPLPEEMEVSIYEDPNCALEDHNYLYDFDHQFLDVQIEEDSSQTVQCPKPFEYKQCKNCTFNCLRRISYDTAKQIHEEFWRMSNYDKNNFYDNTTERTDNKYRPNKRGKQEKYTFLFFFYINNHRMQVCREFYLNTLCISFARVVYFYKIKLERMNKSLQEEL